MADERKDTDRSYLDENLTDEEKEGGHTRLPQPEEEGWGRGKRAEQPMNPERPDEFGDGDRRS